MAIAYVTFKAAFSGNIELTELATAAEVHTTGNALTVSVLVQNATTVTVTDTAGNTFVASPASPVVYDVVSYLWQFYAKNITGHASNIVTAAWSSPNSNAYQVIYVREFSGVGTVAPLSDSDSSTGSGTSLATPTLTLSEASGVIVAFLAGNLGLTAGSGFALDKAVDGYGGYTGDEYKIVSASEAATATANSGAWTISALLLNAVPGGSVTPVYAYAQQ